MPDYGDPLWGLYIKKTIEKGTPKDPETYYICFS